MSYGICAILSCNVLAQRKEALKKEPRKILVEQMSRSHLSVYEVQQNNHIDRRCIHILEY
jgi:hypothetical protein